MHETNMELTFQIKILNNCIVMYSEDLLSDEMKSNLIQLIVFFCLDIFLSCTMSVVEVIQLWKSFV